MYNDNRELGNKLIEDIFLKLKKITQNKIRGRGMFKDFDCRWTLILVCSIIFGLPSTLSSDARFEEGAYYEFDQEEEHSAEEEGADPADASPQPYFKKGIQQRKGYKQRIPEKRNYFYNEVPRNKIPRNVIQKNPIPRNNIEKNPIPSNAIEDSPIERNSIPRQRIERKQIEKNPIPRKQIPRNRIPSN